jgi:hypothetical protein
MLHYGRPPPLTAASFAAIHQQPLLPPFTSGVFYRHSQLERHSHHANTLYLVKDDKNPHPIRQKKSAPIRFIRVPIRPNLP